MAQGRGAIRQTLAAFEGGAQAIRRAFDRQDARPALLRDALRLALKQSGRFVFLYDATQRTLERATDEIAYPFPVEAIMEPENERDLRAFFDQIDSGMIHGETTLRVRFATEAQLGWMRGEFLASDGPGRSRQAVVSFTDIAKIHEREEVYANWENSFAMLPQEQYVVFAHDLNANRLNRVEGKLFDTECLGVNMDFNSRSLLIARTIVDARDRARFVAFFSREKLFGMYHDGVRQPRRDIRIVRPDGRVVWTRLTVQFAEEAQSREIKAYATVIDIDDQKRAQLRGEWLAQADPQSGVIPEDAFLHIVGDALEVMSARTHAMLLVHADAQAEGAASALHAVLRQADAIGRVRPDELALFLSDVPDAQLVQKRAGQLLETLRGRTACARSAIGIALYPRDARDPDALIACARLALETDTDKN